MIKDTDFAFAVKMMRQYQKEFFAEKDQAKRKVLLQESKLWERKVDKMIADHDEQQQNFLAPGPQIC